MEVRSSCRLQGSKRERAPMSSLEGSDRSAGKEKRRPGRSGVLGHARTGSSAAGHRQSAATSSRNRPAHVRLAALVAATRLVEAAARDAEVTPTHCEGRAAADVAAAAIVADDPARAVLAATARARAVVGVTTRVALPHAEPVDAASAAVTSLSVAARLARPAARHALGGSAEAALTDGAAHRAEEVAAAARTACLPDVAAVDRPADARAVGAGGDHPAHALFGDAAPPHAATAVVARAVATDLAPVAALVGRRSGEAELATGHELARRHTRAGVAASAAPARVARATREARLATDAAFAARAAGSEPTRRVDRDARVGSGIAAARVARVLAGAARFAFATTGDAEIAVAAREPGPTGVAVAARLARASTHTTHVACAAHEAGVARVAVAARLARTTTRDAHVCAAADHAAGRAEVSVAAVLSGAAAVTAAPRCTGATDVGTLRARAGARVVDAASTAVASARRATRLARPAARDAETFVASARRAASIVAARLTERAARREHDARAGGSAAEPSAAASVLAADLAGSTALGSSIDRRATVAHDDVARASDALQPGIARPVVATVLTERATHRGTAVTTRRSVRRPVRDRAIGRQLARLTTREDSDEPQKPSSRSHTTTFPRTTEPEAAGPEVPSSSGGPHAWFADGRTDGDDACVGDSPYPPAG